MDYVTKIRLQFALHDLTTGAKIIDIAMDYGFEIPAATYAVFTTPQVLEDDFVDSINVTWTYILQQWFPNSQYEIGEDKFDKVCFISITSSLS